MEFRRGFKIMKKQFLEVGEVVAVHGLRGDMRLYPWCDPGDIERSMRMYTDENGEQEYRVSYAKPHKNVYLVKFKGIDNPEEARKFIGKVLYMNRNDIPVKKGEYFIQDIIGLKVIDNDNGKVYGTVKEIINRGASDIYVIKTENGECMIPAVDKFIASIDLEEGMKVTPIEGMFD
jgi:16S rRNA processing protein RimM